MSAYTPLATTPLNVPIGYQAAIMQSGPILYYPLDDAGGTARELAANQVGTLIGPVTTRINGPGFGYGMHFDATTPWTQWVQTPNAIVFNNNGPYSIECWFRTSSTVLYTTGIWVWAPTSNIIQHPPAGTFGPAMYLNAGSGQLVGFTATATVPVDPANRADGHWHHAVFTNDGNGATGIATLFTDGVQANQVTNIGAVANYSPGGFEIGISGNLNRGGSFTGDVAQFATYTRVLTATEITNHYNAMGYHP